MLLLIAAIILVIGIIGFNVRQVVHNDWGIPFMIGGGVVTAIMCYVLIFNYIYADSQAAVLNEKYEVNLYRVENLDNEKYIDEIGDWNCEILQQQKIDHNFWIGIVVPNYWDDFETIDLNDIAYRTE